jgi:hypothetical protein
MTEETQPTLRDAIVDSIAQHSDPEPAPVVSETPAPAEAAPAPAESKPGRTAGRARAPDGKLLPGKAERQDAAPEQPKPVEPHSTTEAQPAAPAVAPIPRPSSWKKEMWPVWDKLNTGAPLTAQEARQVAEYNAQRETQFATGVSTYKQIADTAKPVLDAIAPFQADLDKHGIAAPDMVHRLMSAHKSLAQGSPHEKLQLFSKLASDYGIPIQALYDQSAQQQFLAMPYTPQPAPVQQQPDIATTVEQILAQREVKQTIESMARDSTKYPFFNYLRSDMSQLLETGEATDLDDAYSKALDLPQHEMLTSLRQQPEPTLEQQRAAQAQGAARAARANTVSPRSATPAPAAPPSGKTSVRDSLRDAIAQHVGGGRV